VTVIVWGVTVELKETLAKHSPSPTHPKASTVAGTDPNSTTILLSVSQEVLVQTDESDPFLVFTRDSVSSGALLTIVDVRLDRTTRPASKVNVAVRVSVWLVEGLVQLRVTFDAPDDPEPNTSWTVIEHSA
jgi:hypothetical protein